MSFPPTLVIQPEVEIDIGNVPQGVLTSMIVLLKNTGEDLLTIGSIASSDPQFVVATSLPVSIPGGQEIQLTVNITPTSTGAISTTLTLNSDDPVSPATYFIFALSIDPTTGGIIQALAGVAGKPIGVMADTIIDQFSTGAVLVKNAGNAALDINAISVVPDQSGVFRLNTTPTYPITINPGDPPFSIPIRFAPIAVGDQGGQLIIKGAPSGPSPTPLNPLYPITFLNGWGPNAHVGDYEGGVDQGHQNPLGLNNDTTFGYSNPNAAVDTDPNTFASMQFLSTHKYAGCVWRFTGFVGTNPGGTLSVDSEIQNIGRSLLRSAAIWYSLNAGVTWINMYDATSKVRGINTVDFDASQNINDIQIMAFADAHDNMVQRVYDIHIDFIPPTPPSDQYEETLDISGLGLQIVPVAPLVLAQSEYLLRMAFFNSEVRQVESLLLNNADIGCDMDLNGTLWENPGYEKTMERLEVFYEDLGVCTLDFTFSVWRPTLTPPAYEVIQKSVQIGTSLKDEKDKSAYVDATVSGEIVEVNVARQAGNGPCKLTALVPHFADRGEKVEGV